MRRASLLVLISGALGCGPTGDSGEGSEGGGSTAEGSTTESGGPTGGGTASVGTSTGGTSTGGTSGSGDEATSAGSSSSGPGPADMGVAEGCSTFLQDCPEGQKCTVFADDGGAAWNAVKCVDVADDPAEVGEPCTSENFGLDGLDSCGVGGFCWDVEQGVGTCLAFCSGSPEEPVCAAEFGCTITANGPLALCFEACDPVAQDCAEMEDSCVPFASEFLCLEVPSDSGLHESCEQLATCEPGFVCVESALAVECDQASQACCEPFCDVTQANTCAGAGQECLPWFESDDAPPELAHVGVCGVPPP